MSSVNNYGWPYPRNKKIKIFTPSYGDKGKCIPATFTSFVYIDRFYKYLSVCMREREREKESLIIKAVAEKFSPEESGFAEIQFILINVHMYISM